MYRVVHLLPCFSLPPTRGFTYFSSLLEAQADAQTHARTAEKIQVQTCGGCLGTWRDEPLACYREDHWQTVEAWG